MVQVHCGIGLLGHTMGNVTRQPLFVVWTSQWRHNGRHGVSNHQPHDCSLNRLSGADQRKHQSSASLALVRGIHRWPVNSPHKWPVTRKKFLFDDVIMETRHLLMKSTGVRSSKFHWNVLQWLDLKIGHQESNLITVMATRVTWKYWQKFAAIVFDRILSAREIFSYNFLIISFF